MLVTLQAEQKKARYQTLRSGSGKSSKVSISLSSDGLEEGDSDGDQI